MRPAFTFRFKSRHDGFIRETLLVFSFSENFLMEHVDDLIRTDIETNLYPDEILFAVPAPAFDLVKRLFSEEDLAQTMIRRLSPTVAATLVAYGQEGQEIKRTPLKAHTSPSKTCLHDLTRAGATHIFNKNNGFVQSTASYHFVNPSGRHTERFIRLSNILVSNAEISFLAFCCLPYLHENVDIVYIDTPALYPILSEVNALRSLFGKNFLHVDNFRSYAGLKEIEPPLGTNPLIVISASSSGGLANMIQSHLRLPAHRFLHFLYLGENRGDFPIVCDLSYHPIQNMEGIEEFPRVFDSGNCELCRQGSFQVYVHGDQFDLKGPQPSPITIRRSDAPKGLSETIQRLGSTNALGMRAGLTGQKDFYIDVDKLFVSSKQKEHLKYVLRRAVPASATHVIQVDDGSVKLAKRIRKHINDCGGSAEIVTKDHIESVGHHSSPSIVVAATVIESGRCLTDMSRELRSVVEDSPILYLVGVDKTTQLPPRVALGRTLAECPHPIPHQYLAVETITLPTSNPRNSWNDEADLFRDPDIRSQLSPSTIKIADSRLRELTKTSRSLASDGLFLQSSNGTTLTLQPDFVFLPNKSAGRKYTQADVFFTIASILQRLRANAQSGAADTAIRNAWYHQTILDPSNFTRYNDDIIQASILRAATPAELNYRENPAESREAGRIIVKLVQASLLPRGGAAPEFMLAIATKRLGLRAEDRKLVIQEAKYSDGIVGDLGRIMEHSFSKD